MVTTRTRTGRLQQFRKTTTNGWMVIVTVPHEDEPMDEDDAREIVETLEAFTRTLREAFEATKSLNTFTKLGQPPS
jgi:hypothetical protein